MSNILIKLLMILVFFYAAVALLLYIGCNTIEEN